MNKNFLFALIVLFIIITPVVIIISYAPEEVDSYFYYYIPFTVGILFIFLFILLYKSLKKEFKKDKDKKILYEVRFRGAPYVFFQQNRILLTLFYIGIVVFLEYKILDISNSSDLVMTFVSALILLFVLALSAFSLFFIEYHYQFTNDGFYFGLGRRKGRFHPWRLIVDYIEWKNKIVLCSFKLSKNKIRRFFQPYRHQTFTQGVISDFARGRLVFPIYIKNNYKEIKKLIDKKIKRK